MKTKQLLSVLRLFAFLSIMLTFTTCRKEKDENSDTPSETGTVADIEGNVYKTIKLGDQWWMAENLKTTKYNDGTTIPEEKDGSTWYALTTPAYCWYNNDVVNKNTYGALYNWYTVNTGKLAPAGWHVPTDDEWKQLEMTLGMTKSEANATSYRGTNEGTKLKNTFGWSYNGAGTNTSGFSALPGSCRISLGNFDDLGKNGEWWSATEEPISQYVWSRALSYNSTEVFRFYYKKVFGYSVRCVKD